MNYAVIAISGSQYQVSKDQTITVDNLNQKEGQKITTDQVLLLVDGKQVTIGKPTVKDTTVTAKIIKNYKGKKIRVFKYKAKSRYRKTQGFRPQLTDIKITDISTKNVKKASKTTKTK